VVGAYVVDLLVEERVIVEPAPANAMLSVFIGVHLWFHF